MDVPEHLRRYRHDIFDDKYFRLSFEDVSRTITAHIAKDGYWYIHPQQDRTLSVREAARIQTFPDRFRFAGHPTNRFRQIGNAVPPLLASAIATEVRQSLNGSSTPPAIGERRAYYGSTFRSALIGWFRVHGREFPWRNTKLTPWQFLLVEMCLHRTKADQVARVIREVMTLGGTPESFLANANELKPYLSTLGLNWRSANLAAAAQTCSGQADRAGPEQLARAYGYPRSRRLHCLGGAVFRLRSPQCADRYKHPPDRP